MEGYVTTDRQTRQCDLNVAAVFSATEHTALHSKRVMSDGAHVTAIDSLYL